MNHYYSKTLHIQRDFIASRVSADILLTHEVAYLYDKTIVL